MISPQMMVFPVRVQVPVALATVPHFEARSQNIFAAHFASADPPQVLAGLLLLLLLVVPPLPPEPPPPTPPVPLVPPVPVLPPLPPEPPVPDRQSLSSPQYSFEAHPLVLVQGLTLHGSTPLAH
jgi:hypothetical protein